MRCERRITSRNNQSSREYERVDLRRGRRNLIDGAWFLVICTALQHGKYIAYLGFEGG